MSNSIVCAGSINIDISASATRPINPGGKNPGAEVVVSPGGVVQNVGEVLARIGNRVSLISTAGVGGFNDTAVNGCRLAGADITHIARKPDVNVITCILVNDHKGDLVVMAASPQDPRCLVSADQIMAADGIIRRCDCMFVCPTLSIEALNCIVQNYPDVVKMSDVGSVYSVPKLTPYLKYLHTLKVNEREAQAFSGCSTDTDNGVKRAAAEILKLGVQNVVITLGERGAAYANKDFCRFYGIKKVDDVKNTSGAGDSFFAGLMHGYAEGMDTDTTMEFAAACSRLTIQSRHTINPDITLQAVLKEMHR